MKNEPLKGTGSVFLKTVRYYLIDILALFGILLFYIIFIPKIFAFGENNRTPLMICLTPGGFY